MGKRVTIPPPAVCFACRGSSNGKCVKHDDKKGLSPDEQLWKEADEAPRDASPWESAFLDSIRKQLDRGTPLSRRQREKLEEIHNGLNREGTDESETGENL